MEIRINETSIYYILYEKLYEVVMMCELPAGNKIELFRSQSLEQNTRSCEFLWFVASIPWSVVEGPDSG